MPSTERFAVVQQRRYAGSSSNGHRLHSCMVVRYEPEIAIEASAWARQGACELEHQASKSIEYHVSIATIYLIINFQLPKLPGISVIHAGTDLEIRQAGTKQPVATPTL